MKKTLLFLLLTMSLTINAEDTVTVVNENNVYCGETVEVDVYLQNQKEIKELEFMVLVENHFEIIDIEGWRRIDNYSVKCTELRINLYKVELIPLNNNSIITCGNNCIVKLRIKVPETNTNTYTFDLYNIRTTYTDDTIKYLDDYSFSMYVIGNPTTNINDVRLNNCNVVGYIGGIVFVRSGNKIKKVIKKRP